MDARVCLFELVNEASRDNEDGWFFLIELSDWHVEQISPSFEMNPPFVWVCCEQIFIELQ